MSKQQNTDRSTPSAVAVRNHEVRRQVLAYHVREQNSRGEEKVESRQLVVLPGLNLLPHDELVLCCAGGDLAELERASNATLEILDEPHKLRATEARRLISETASRRVLQEWRKREQREEVRAAIDEELAKEQQT